MNPDDGGMLRSVTELLPLLFGWLVAFALAIARPMALVQVLPAFSRTGIAGLVRGGIAAALCLPALPELHRALTAASPSGFVLLVLSVKEAVLGTVLGLLLGAPFWAFEIAGDVLDLQRGATQGRIDDPGGYGDVSISGTFLLVIGVVLYTASGGLEVVADSLYRSWRIWPALSGLPKMDPVAPDLLLGMLDQMTRQALRLAAPVVLAMLLADVSLILIGRVAPNLRIDSQALAVRNLAFFLFLPLYSAFLLFYLRQDLTQLPHALDAMRNAMPGAEP